MHDPSIRRARPCDAGAIANLVRGSISELCFDDHEGDAEKIDLWLASKTEENISSWITASDLSVFVIACSTGLAAAGCHRDDGVILMNYVSRFYRFQGLSGRMLAFLEASLAARDLAEARLVSTRTALPFYESRGWHIYGDPIPCYGIAGQPMKKNLSNATVGTSHGM